MLLFLFLVSLFLYIQYAGILHVGENDEMFFLFFLVCLLGSFLDFFVYFCVLFYFFGILDIYGKFPKEGRMMTDRRNVCDGNEKINNEYQKKCIENLTAGRVKIADVPYEYRCRDAYEKAHEFARNIQNDMQRHDQYWRIQHLLEEDISRARAERKAKKLDSLLLVYKNLFDFATKEFP